MKVSELIKRLESLRDWGGDVDVRVCSNDYCMDVNKIECVVYNGDKDKIEIIVTK